MDFFRSNRAVKSPELPPEKRISTPAGMRLSVIMENGQNDRPNSKRSSQNRHSFRKSLLPGAFAADVPRESQEDAANKSFGTSIWSDADGEKLGGFRNNRQIAKRGGWKRLALIVALVLTAVIAIIIGAVVGTRKKSSKR